MEERLVMAGIVTYNPDIELLRKNIISVKRTVNDLAVVDNGSANIDDVKKLLDELSSGNFNVVLYELNENKGIAAALNMLMENGKKNNFKWVLTLDQDSVVPSNIIESNIQILKNSDDVAIISAVIEDRNIKHHKIEKSAENYSEVNMCITSASLTSVRIWDIVGKFDEFMFIDSVDTEYCLRIKRNKYKILRNNEVVLLHSIGKISEVKVFGRWITIYNHSAFRKYYQVRNILYTQKKTFGVYSFQTFIEILKMYFKVVFFEEDKKNKLERMNNGFIDGIRISRKIKTIDI